MLRTQFRGRLAPSAASALAGLLAVTVPAFGFDSGSTGADGAFAPSVSTRLPLPENGVFNFTSVEIPEDVIVTFERNTTNTPAVILASGDVSIAGTIDLRGADSPAVGAAGDGVTGDDGLPGKGGPGGYDGGAGGPTDGDHVGSSGQGPGAGGQGVLDDEYRGHGGGGGFGAAARVYNGAASTGRLGQPYGSSLLLPLIGGSGGGGGMGGNSFAGSGGGGGGGALLIAASGTLSVTGAIQADGGRAGESGGGNCGAVGGGGSGGGIRLVASTLVGEGAITAEGANRSKAKCQSDGYYLNSESYSSWGGAGRIRLEAETFNRKAATKPAYSFGVPGDLYVAGLPRLRIASVAGVAAPDSPTGVADIQLSADVANPVTVQFEATGIPVGNIVELTLTPARGAAVKAVSNALDGTGERTTASATVELPQGPSTLLASVTYTLVASVADGLSRFAGEPVKALRVAAGTDGVTRYQLITVNGRAIPVTQAQLATAG